MSRSTRMLLIGAVSATPLMVVLWAVQALTRTGFRPTFHPMSLLSLGDFGWVQIGNFVLTGVLVMGGGIGLGRALKVGRLTRCASALVFVMGVGLVVAGVFVTDAGAGFPVGAPEGAPDMSWHGVIHEAGFLLTQIAFLAVGIVLAVRFARSDQRGWAVACVAIVVAAGSVAAVGDPTTLAIRLVDQRGSGAGLVSTLALGSLLQRVRQLPSAVRSSSAAQPDERIRSDRFAQVGMLALRDGRPEVLRVQPHGLRHPLGRFPGRNGATCHELVGVTQMSRLRRRKLLSAARQADWTASSSGTAAARSDDPLTSGRWSVTGHTSPITAKAPGSFAITVGFSPRRADPIRSERHPAGGSSTQRPYRSSRPPS